MTTPSRGFGAVLVRALGTLLLAVVVAATGSAFGISTAHAGAGLSKDGSGTTDPGGGGTIQVLGVHHARSCVKHFQPGSTIHVHNQTTGQSTTIRSNAGGKGCGSLPVKRSCQATTQTIVETGTGRDGKPSTVTQTVTTPATASLCAGTAAAGSTLPFTGSGIIIPGTIIGLALIALGTAMTLVRRRRASGVTG